MAVESVTVRPASQRRAARLAQISAAWVSFRVVGDKVRIGKAYAPVTGPLQGRGPGKYEAKVLKLLNELLGAGLDVSEIGQLFWTAVERVQLTNPGVQVFPPTRYTVAERLAHITKNADDPRAALLSLPKDLQQQLVDSWRGEK